MLAECVESLLRAKISRLPQPSQSFKAQAHHKLLHRTPLWHCSYDTPISLNFPEIDFVRVQFPYKGRGLTRLHGHEVPVTGHSACISSQPVEIDFNKGFRQIVWQIPRDMIAQKLSALTGVPITGRVEFLPNYDLSTSAAQGTANILSCILRQLETTPSRVGDLAIAELEQAMLTAFLGSSRHNYSQLFECDAPTVAPWQVLRTESFLDANWDRPIQMEEVAMATGASLRSIFRTFKQYRGYTPRDFLKRVRLNHARKMLIGEEGAADTVTQVAFNCGYGDLSAFSKDFLTAFGESPSALLRRSRRQD
jgi:AraC-like DNA-binding protein